MNINWEPNHDASRFRKKKTLRKPKLDTMPCPVKSPTGDYHVAKDDTVRCWVCSGSGDVKDKKTGEIRYCRACLGKGRVKV